MEDSSGSSKLFVDDPENDLFFFETDHLALRGNKDYCDALKTVVRLSALRERAVKDYNKIVEMKKKVLDNPWDLIEKIRKGEKTDLDIPPMYELPKLPVINFNKYDVKIPESDITAIYSNSVNVKQEDDIKKSSNSSKINNKSWSPEEQKRLEELLQRFPPEPVEMRRFQKIAAALGNRTVHQVSSRVQKYFLKLFKAGLPIPGRIPKSSEKYRKSALHKHQRFNHYLTKPTTFFPDLYIPVTMNDCDDTPGPSSVPSITTSTTNTSHLKVPTQSQQQTTNYLMQSDYHQNANIHVHKSESEMKLELLKRVRIEKLKEQDGDTGNHPKYQHTGYKCDYCDSDPIVGSRWHCLTCCKESIDFCTDCVLSQLYSSEPHPLDHILVIFNGEAEFSSMAGGTTNSNSSLPSDSESHVSSVRNVRACDDEDDVVDSDDSAEEEDIDGVRSGDNENNEEDDYIANIPDRDNNDCFNYKEIMAEDNSKDSI